MSDQDQDRRIDRLQDMADETHDQLAELTVVVMGPGPAHDNGIRGDLKALKTAFYAYKDECRGEDSNVKTAQINLKGIYVTTIVQGVIAIGVALIALLK